MIRMLKITGKVLLALILLLAVVLLSIFFLYNEKLPEGEQSIEADQLAEKMLRAINHEAYKQTSYIEWSFVGRQHYKWNKQQQLVEVKWGETVVNLNIQHTDSSTVTVNNSKVTGAARLEKIEQAVAHFNNDSFWLIAPHKAFDLGTERRIVSLENGKKALLVSYSSGGNTPGDSYLWLLDETGLPKAFKMWVSVIPIGGLEATWQSWEASESGALFPSTHQFLFLDINMGDVKARK
ncbi:MAG: hypothetical protein QMC40_00010 [Vicingaceae bacterium]|jgi:hypothetical protein